jgi:hypothetical protein
VSQRLVGFHRQVVTPESWDVIERGVHKMPAEKGTLCRAASESGQTMSDPLQGEVCMRCSMDLVCMSFGKRPAKA